MNTDALLADLIRDEGLKLMPYTDTVGKMTIGVGRNLTDRGISHDEAMLMAQNDIADSVSELDRAVPWWKTLSPIRQCALANMQFNMGWSRLSKFKLMLAALEVGDFESAANEALNSDWAKQTGDRAIRISTMLKEG